MTTGLRHMLVATVMFAAAASATAQVLTFEGLTQNEPVLNYYNGGTGGLGSGPGPNFGITFSPNAATGIDNSQGGLSPVRNLPSPVTFMAFATGVSAVMNVPGGFVTGFSFFYASIAPTTVRVYSGLNATGTVLATITLPGNNSGAPCGTPPTASFCTWTAAGAGFVGTAMSIDFGGTTNQVGFDNITINSATPGGAVAPTPAIPVPTLGHVGLMLLSLFGAIAGATVLRRRNSVR